METLLITKEDFTPYRNLSVKVDQSQLEPYILEAQRIDLPQYLGKSLTAKLIQVIATYRANKDAYVATETQLNYLPTPEEQDYLWLLNGRSYVSEFGIHLNYIGLKAVLVYLTYSRYVRQAHIFSTQSGFKINQNQYSEHVSQRDINDMATRAENDAQFFMNQVRDYLKEFSFLETKTSCCIDEANPDPRRLKLGAIKGNRLNCRNRCR